MTVAVGLAFISPSHSWAVYRFSDCVARLVHPNDKDKTRYVVQLPEGMTHVSLGGDLPQGFETPVNGEIVDGEYHFPATQLYYRQLVFDVSSDTDPAFVKGFVDGSTQKYHPLDPDDRVISWQVERLLAALLSHQLNQRRNQGESSIEPVASSDLQQWQMNPLGSHDFAAPILDGQSGIDFHFAPRLRVSTEKDDLSDSGKNFDRFSEWMKQRMTWYTPFFDTLAHPCRYFPQLVGLWLYVLLVPGAYLVAIVVPNNILETQEAEVSVGSYQLFKAFREVTDNFTRDPGPNEYINVNGTVVSLHTGEDQSLSVAEAVSITWIMDAVKVVASVLILKYPHIALGPLQGVVVGVVNLCATGCGRTRVKQ